MRLNEISRGGKALIDGYGPGFFRVSGRLIDGPVVVCAREAKAWGGYGDFEPIASLRNEIDVLLVGTGNETAPVPGDFGVALEQAGIIPEFMATPPACRT
ncbi:MAG: Mth938-like domain-containing protein [Albidovulum sp.]|nr:Mth938-like domain-containing protein [Albidovulum sp.]